MKEQINEYINKKSERQSPRGKSWFVYYFFFFFIVFLFVRMSLSLFLLFFFFGFWSFSPVHINAVANLLFLSESEGE